MSETFKHQCIKPGCGNVYNSIDPDAYYCQSCNEERKLIAKEIDKKMGVNHATKADSQPSVFERYDEIRKTTGVFVPAKDLGLI